MAGLIGELIEHVPTVRSKSINQEVYDYFKKDTTCSGIVVVDDQIPVGLITRTQFFQKIGSLYGFHLYIKKQVNQLMKKDILVVDYSSSIIDVSRLAMERKEEELYDYVIVTKNGTYQGVVSISRLLMKFAEMQAKIASYLNPLTRLPGNHLINEQLKNLIKEKEFSVLYIDLDYFKAYNDVYGFSKGDKMIKTIAEILVKNISDCYGFIGHIGGDDFIATLNHYYYEQCCQSILKDFKEIIPTFYSEKHLKQQFIFTEDRLGNKQNIPLVTLSIAVVTNEGTSFSDPEELANLVAKYKQICKTIPGNCYYDGKIHISS